jgi:hypothetical protein
MVLQKTQRASSEVADFSITTSATDELKILVSAVQFRPWPPLFQLLTHESRDALVAVREFSGTSGHAKPAQDDELGLPAVGFAHTVRRFQEL